MAFKRNIKLYIKEKSTWMALCTILIFLILFSISFVPALKNKKGIHDNFKHYSISFLTTNNYNVIYAACDQYLFYSQNKAHQSSLNDFTGIKDYSNAYGSFNPKAYNFIKIDFDFSSKIMDVQGISDNYLGSGGETLVLTENGNVYMISQRNDRVQLLLKNIEKMSIKRDYENNQNYYIVQDNEKKLYQCYLSNNTLIKEKIYDEDVEEFFFLNTKDNINNYIIKKENQLFLLSVDYPQEEWIDEVGNAYPIIENVASYTSSCVDLKVTAEKIKQIGNQFYILNQSKVSLLTFEDTLKQNELFCEESVKDIYTCGENACIAITDNGLYYYGILKDYEDSFDGFSKTKIEEGFVYGSKNALIHYTHHRLYLFNEEKVWETMYVNWFVNYVLRYFSLFVIAMSGFYLILSFYDANKRYNRYFAVNTKEKL